LFDGEREACILIPEHLGQPCLVIEQQPVLASSGQYVQAVAHAPQKCLSFFQQP
jgi:hypothetical protein